MLGKFRFITPMILASAVILFYIVVYMNNATITSDPGAPILSQSRYLSLPYEDPLLADEQALEYLICSLKGDDHPRELPWRSPVSAKFSSRALVDDFIRRNPLYVIVDTRAKLSSKEFLIRRTVKRVYLSDESR
jgi:hypothetical protein